MSRVFSTNIVVVADLLVLVDGRNVGPRKYGYLSIRKTRSHGAQRGQRHDGIADPVRCPNQDFHRETPRAVCKFRCNGCHEFCSRQQSQNRLQRRRSESPCPFLDSDFPHLFLWLQMQWRLPFARPSPIGEGHPLCIDDDPEICFPPRREHPSGSESLKNAWGLPIPQKAKNGP